MKNTYRHTFDLQHKIRDSHGGSFIINKCIIINDELDKLEGFLKAVDKDARNNDLHLTPLMYKAELKNRMNGVVGNIITQNVKAYIASCIERRKQSMEYSKEMIEGYNTMN